MIAASATKADWHFLYVQNLRGCCAGHFSKGHLVKGLLHSRVSTHPLSCTVLLGRSAASPLGSSMCMSCICISCCQTCCIATSCCQTCSMVHTAVDIGAACRLRTMLHLLARVTLLVTPDTAGRQAQCNTDVDALGKARTWRNVRLEGLQCLWAVHSNYCEHGLASRIHTNNALCHGQVWHRSDGPG